MVELVNRPSRELGCLPTRELLSSLWVRLLLRLRRSVPGEELIERLVISFSKPPETLARDGRAVSFFEDGRPRMEPDGVGT